MNAASLIAGLAALNTNRNNSMSVCDKAKYEIEKASKSDEEFWIFIATLLRLIKMHEPSPEPIPQQKLY